MRYIIPILVIAVCISSYFVYIEPAYSEIRVLRAQKAEYSDTLKKSKELKEMRDAILSAYNNISPENIDRLNKILPLTLNPVYLAMNLNYLASKHSLDFSGFKTDIVDKVEDGSRDPSVISDEPKPYKETDVTFVVKGTYPDFSAFLSDIETSLQLMDVISLSIKSGAKVDTPNVPLEYTVELRTYSLH